MLLVHYILVLMMQLPIYPAADVKSDCLNIEWGVKFSPGYQATISQRCVALQNFKGDNNELFFGLYDGHGGPEAAYTAAYGRKYSDQEILPLHDLIAQLPDDCVHEAYKSIDESICADESHSSGTSAITVRIKSGGKISYARVGNSRLLFIKNDASSIATKDHTVENAVEVARVKDVQGGNDYIREWQEKILPRGLKSSMLITRSLGDRRLKEIVKGLTAIPSVVDGVVIENGKLQYKQLVVASRSLWSHLDDQEVVAIVQDVLNHNDSSQDGFKRSSIRWKNQVLLKAAGNLIDQAKQKGCIDNITVIVIEFSLAKKEAQPIQHFGYHYFQRVIYATEINEDDCVVPPVQPIENAVEQSFDIAFAINLYKKLSLVKQMMSF